MNESPLSSLTKTKLRNSILSGTSYADIAKKYGVTRQAVYLRVLTLGLGNLKSSLISRRNEKIIRMHNRKTPVKEIIAKYNLSHNQVYLIIRKSETPCLTKK